MLPGMWRARRAAVVLFLLLSSVAARGAAQSLPPEDAQCIREMSRGIAVFTRNGVNEVLRARIATGEAGTLSPGLVEALRAALVDNCTSIPLYSLEGVCSGVGSIAAWIDCVVALQQSAVVTLADAVVGGGVGPTPSPTVTATSTPRPTPTRTPRPPTCAGLTKPCGSRSCCAGLRCVLTGSTREPLCQPAPPPPPSASGAFLDADGARFF